MENVEEDDNTNYNYPVFYGYDITPYLKPGKNAILFEMAPPFQKSVRLSVHVCSHVSIKQVYDYVKHNNTLEKEMCIKMIRDIIQENAMLLYPNTNIENVPLEQKVETCSVICPISLCPMKTPARFNACSHIQCFDLMTFLIMNLSHPEMKCPLCPCKGSKEMLIIDAFYKDKMETCIKKNKEVFLIHHAHLSVSYSGSLNEMQHNNGEKNLEDNNKDNLYDGYGESIINDIIF